MAAAEEGGAEGHKVGDCVGAISDELFGVSMVSSKDMAVLWGCWLLVEQTSCRTDAMSA